MTSEDTNDSAHCERASSPKEELSWHDSDFQGTWAQSNNHAHIFRQRNLVTTPHRQVHLPWVAEVRKKQGLTVSLKWQDMPIPNDKNNSRPFPGLLYSRKVLNVLHILLHLQKPYKEEVTPTLQMKKLRLRENK